MPADVLIEIGNYQPIGGLFAPSTLAEAAGRL